MTLIDVYLDVLVLGRCDVCRRARRVYPDPETGGNICLDCLEQCLEPLPEGPEDAGFMEIALQVLAKHCAAQDAL